MFIKYKRNAFTLAEVLITLGIIGVVAALTIPTLFENYQKKQTVSKLQKAISVLNQAYKLSFDDLGEPDSALDLGAEEYFKTYWAPYIKVSTYCSKAADCGYKSNNPFISLDNSNMNVGIADGKNSTRTAFLTPDGFMYIVYTANYPNGSKDPKPFYRVLVDINGSTPPNRSGNDVFWLVRAEEDGIHPDGYSSSLKSVQQYCSYDLSGGSSGNTCGDYIRRSGWKIDSSYPWKPKKK